MVISISIAAIISAIAGLVIAQTTGGLLIGLVVFFALFLMLSGAGLTFLSVLSIPKVVWILIIILFIWGLSKKK